jgi:DNA-binding ferritin-like protein
VGRHFISDHELLGEIYEQLQGQIDSLAELIRTLGDFMPTSLSEVMVNSHNADEAMTGTSDQLLSAVKDHLEHLFDCYVDLNEVADEEDLEHIANYAQEQMLILKKFIWKLESVLE